MRRLARHRADAEIDARFTEITGQELRVGVGDVEDACVAEALEIVDAGLSAARGARQSAGKSRGTRKSKKVSAADGHLAFASSSRRLLPAVSVSRDPSRPLFPGPFEKSTRVREP